MSAVGAAGHKDKQVRSTERVADTHIKPMEVRREAGPRRPSASLDPSEAYLSARRLGRALLTLNERP